MGGIWKDREEVKRYVEEKVMWVKLLLWISIVYLGGDEDVGLIKGILLGLVGDKVINIEYG